MIFWNFLWHFSQKQIVVECADGNIVTLYDTAGRQLSTVKADAQGRATVTLTALPQGTYIIKANQSTLKIKK